MVAKFTIPGRLPGLNDYIKAERGNKYVAAKIKRETEALIGVAIRSKLRGARFHAPVTMHYCWYEPNTRRDKDNISFARKFVQDALVGAGVLQGDGWKHIDGFTDRFFVDANTPRVEVTITDEWKG